MEELGQNYGFVLYRVVKELKGLLQLKEIRDFAIVSQNGQCRAVLDRRVKVRSRVVAHKGLPPFVLPLPPTYPLEVELEGGAPLDILVENMGRVNYGSHMVDDRKGIVGPVTLEGSTLTGWENYSLPMTDFSQLRFSSSHPKGPAFFRGQFELPSLGDTFLDLRGWVKGCVWVNGHNLGRYWNIGPQQSLFLPATWLIQGTNSVLVFELIPSGVGRRSLRGVKDPIWSTAKS
jgi:beta-galactosidase